MVLYGRTITIIDFDEPMPLAETTLASLPWFMRMKDMAVYAWELSEGGFFCCAAYERISAGVCTAVAVVIED